MKSISELYHKLGIQPPKREYNQTMVNRKEIPAWLYKQKQMKWKIAMKEFKRSLNKYRTGSNKEWEGGGYFIKPIYTYEGVQYS